VPVLEASAPACSPDAQWLTDAASALTRYEQLPRGAVLARGAAARALAGSPSIRDVLRQASSKGTHRQAALDIARAHVDAHQSARWTDDVAQWASLLKMTWEESASFVANVTWRERQKGNSVLLHLTLDEVAGEVQGPAARTELHLLATGLRYDFRCAALVNLFDQITTPVNELDPYSRAQHAFALLGQSDPAGLAHMDSTLASAPDNAQVGHTLLHGLWLGVGLPDQAQRILDLASSHPAFAGGTDPIALFRQAMAYRRLGKFSEALTSITSAIELLPYGTDAMVHDQFVREWGLLTSSPS